MLDCLVGCVGAYNCKPIRTLEEFDFATMSPYVKLRFENASDYITVGNESYPIRENQAVIKSFEYGASNGLDMRIEIFDEQGGAFDRFWNEMPRTLEEVDVLPRLVAEFGWIGRDCNTLLPKIPSPKITCVCIAIETSLTQGKIKFVINAQDLQAYNFEARASRAFGGDKAQKLSLKAAIRKLFGENAPTCKVEFLKKGLNGGKPQEWKFQREFGPNGPEGVWLSDQQNKLAAAMEWLSPFRTEDDKGIVPTFDVENNILIFWEDWIPNENTQNDCGINSLGTFIVNGGRCSSVLDFSPKIDFIGALYRKSGQGGGISPGTSAPVEKENTFLKQASDIGSMFGLNLQMSAINAYGPEPAGKQSVKSDTSHMVANTIFTAGGKPISGDLRIVGNPNREFCGVKEAKAKNVSIVVIDPFHLVGGGTDNCPEWLAQPVCNQYLSNKKWWVMGISHSITEGSYTTTIKVLLEPPKIGWLGGN